MKKISAPRVLKKITSAALKQGISVKPGSKADKTTKDIVNSTVETANKGIALGNSLVKKGEGVLEGIREKIHAASAPKAAPKK